MRRWFLGFAGILLAMSLLAGTGMVRVGTPARGSEVGEGQTVLIPSPAQEMSVSRPVPTAEPPSSRATAPAPADGDQPAAGPVPAGRVPAAPAPSEPSPANPAGPAPPKPPAVLPRATVRGIYLTGTTAATRGRFDALLGLIDRTELNAMVVDVKDDWGILTYRSGLPLAVEAGAVRGGIGDLREFVTRLKRHNVYAIARVVTFKDNFIPRYRPELAVHRRDGGLWHDRKGMSWLNPYSRQAWDYVLDVAEEAARAGFDEIQFDYVRFPSDGDVSAIIYPQHDERRREQVIADFLTYAREKLEPLGVWVSADIFGITLTAVDDQGIGQLLEEVARGPHIISPMVYPSHYGPGNFGFANPNAHPYETVRGALQDAHRRLDQRFPNLIVRPWLQDFSLGAPRYSAEQVRAQIQAVYDSGIQEWLLWNAGNVYSEAALKSAAETPPVPPARITLWGPLGTAARVELRAD